MSDLPDDLGIPMKPARPAGQPASVAPLGRNPAPVPPRLAVADVNGDGLLDIVTSNKKGTFLLQQVRAKK